MLDTVKNLEKCINYCNKIIYENVPPPKNKYYNPTHHNEWNGIDWTGDEISYFETRHNTSDMFPVNMNSYSEIIKFQLSDVFNVSKKMIDNAWNIASKKTSARITIKNGVIHVKSSGPDIGRRSKVLNIINSVHKKLKLPDTDFVILLSDLPPEQEWINTDLAKKSNRAPIFMPTRRSTQSNILLIPDYTFQDFWDHKQNKNYKNIISNPFTKRIPKIYFAGGINKYRAAAWCLGIKTKNGSLMTGLDTEAIKFSTSNKNYCKLPVWKKPQTHLDMYKYKFVLSPGGGTWPSWSTRFKFLFSGRSTPIVSKSDWYEFFYPLLRPYKDFVPAENTISSVSRYIYPTGECLRKFPNASESIANNAFMFQQKYLSKKIVFQYVHDIISEYTMRINN
mgnify:CR=1 FL=1